LNWLDVEECWGCYDNLLHFLVLPTLLQMKGLVTNAKNIKADMPKILRPTHFSCMKDIKAKKLDVGVIP
jgi:hypothetical protein